MTSIRFLFICMAFLPGMVFAAASEPLVKDIATRPNVTVRVLLMKPSNPAAVVVLFADGNGGLNLTANGAIRSLSSDFLVRSRNRFVRNDLTVAAIDTPSDRLPSPALNGFRQTAEHAQDVGAVIAFLRKEANIPVWLVGTGRGTISVANAAIRMQQGGPDGIVLTSSIVGNSDSGSLTKMNVAQITARTFLVHHSEDQCAISLFQNVKPLINQINRAPMVDLLVISGATQPRGDPCGALDYHGFPGTEDAVVMRIANWIKHGSPGG